MENEKSLVNKRHVEILEQQIAVYKGNGDAYVRGMGEGMRIALEFLRGGQRADAV